MKKYQNREWLYKKYCIEHLSVSDIAQERKVGMTTICRWLARFRLRKIKPHKIDCKGSKAPYWKGGRYKDNTSGYILLYNPKHSCASKKGYVREHRLIMEKFLGRYLKKNELVHHKNGVKDDNRIQNLEMIRVLSGGQHYGSIQCPFCNKYFKIK